MNSKDIVSLYEAYSAVYDEGLRDELEFEPIQEDISFIDDLSDNELDHIMEDLFASGEVNINECFDSLDYVLIEARVTSSDDRQSGSARVTTSSERPSRVAKTAERQRQVRIGRIAQAAQRAGEKLASPARSTGTSVSSRVGQATQKVKSAKEKVKGFLGKLGRAAKAGASAAKKEFSGQAEREAQARTTGRQMRRVARRQASAERSRDTSEFTKKSSGKPSDPWSGSATKPSLRPSATTKTTKALSGSSAKAALPPAKESDRRAAAKAKLQKAAAGSTAKGIRFAGERVGQLATQRAHTGKQSALEKFRKKIGVSEEIFNQILNTIFEEMIHEGYVDSYENALYVLESLSESDVQDVVESYLVEETEVVDLYDVVLEHLLDEGFAETEEAATVIMANMSEEWRDEILEGMSDRPLGLMHQFARGMKQKKGEKFEQKYKQDREGNLVGKYSDMQRSKRTK